ncbi:nSTAND1 domain-containing NTPase [Streptomyces fuscichromogenes]|uniref:nSTAND1 domain-containing NTPase n=1 Tax=Streptomyces fuscichromogenes TaxID=1324013 RepID=UPI0016715A6B|nr:trypsin-like peptidase domain-containing protein [Streptomyces fuscichromogenes]
MATDSPNPDAGFGGAAAPHACGAVAQVLADGGGVAGAGFLIAPDAVATCAHVIQDCGSSPGGRVEFAFVGLHGAPQVTGRVLTGTWRPPDGDDVAVVRLDEPVTAVHPLPFGSARGSREHPVWSYGFPAQAPRGGHFGYATAGELLTGAPGRTGPLLQLTDANDLTQGFSGGPVVDEVSGLVIGMLTSIAPPDGHMRGQNIAYATPTEVLREIWPVLRESALRPYRGLEPFTAEHAAFFHGRDDALESVLGALATRRRGVLLLGPSGSGKTSLIQAGVLPALAEGAVPGSDRWLPVLVPRPGTDLSAEADRHGLPGARYEGIVAAVRARLAAEPVCDRIVLIIDQFEEVFTPAARMSAPAGRPDAPKAAETARGETTGGEADDDTARSGETALMSAIEQLTALLGSREAVSLVLIMRDDFYPRLAAQAPLLLKAAASGILNVPTTLGRGQLRAIVSRPAQRAGIRFEKGLCERIVADVLAADHEDALAGRAPVALLAPLELTLNRLWERRSDGRLTHEAYERIGRIAGSLTNWCDSALDDLPASHHTVARRILTALVRPADAVRRVPATRQRVPLRILRELAAHVSDTDPQEADERTGTVLATLTRHRVITVHADPTGGSPGGEVAELVHDTLTRDWEELREWVAQDARFQAWLHRAEEARARWDRCRDPGDLLHGSDLAAGLEWLEQRRLPREITAFVHAGRRNQQAIVHRARVINVVLASVLALFVIATGVAFWQRQAATFERQEASTVQRQADSRRLALQSGALLDTDPDLAALLAVAAHRLSPTREATAALYTAAGLPLRRRLTGDLCSVAFSPDGRTLVTGSLDGSLRWWDPATGRLRARVAGGGGSVCSLAFSPDGRTLATVGAKAQLRDAATGRVRTTLAVPRKYTIDRIGFSGDGRSAVTADGLGRTVRIWDADTGRVRVAFRGFRDFVRAAELSPDGRFIAITDASGVQLRDVVTGDVRLHLATSSDDVTSMAFAPDGRTLVTGGGDGALCWWDPVTGRLQAKDTSHKDLVSSMVFSRDGRTLATGSYDNTARLWDNVTHSARTVFVGHKEPVQEVALSPDGHTLASVGAWSGGVRLWNVAQKTGSITFTGRSDMDAVAFSRDGRTVAASQYEGRVRLWDPATGRERETLARQPLTADALVFLPDGRTLMCVGRDVQLWDAASGRRRTVLTTPKNEEIVASPDGRLLATVADRGVVHVWSAVTGRLRRSIASGGVYTRADAFSPDGRILATVEWPRVRLWAVASGRLRAQISSQDEVSTVAFSPDGRMVATGGVGGTVRLWDVPTGRFRAEFSGHSDEVTDVAFSPDGRSLAAASTDHTTLLWDIATGSLRSTFTGHNSAVLAVAFSPDGHMLATGGRDHTVRLWNVELPRSTAAIHMVCRAVGRDLTEEERAEYLPNERLRACAPQ